MTDHHDEGMTRVGSGHAGGLTPGTTLNGLYRIEERLGTGGMGEVYRAINLANEEQDAIKVIGRGLAGQPLVEALFHKEARVLRRIHSPAVAQLRLLARDPTLDLLYFATEFVEGVSLLDRLKQRAATEAELRALLRRLLTGIAAVHEAGAVHRDLSPDNVILPGGVVTEAKLIDFGIAKELDPTHTTIIGDGFAGKFGYIAPEQFGYSNSRIGPWTDLYSLALVGIAFAAGKPLDMGHSLGTADEARRRAIPFDAVPASLRPFFAALLTYDWPARVASAAEALALLDGAPARVEEVVQPSPTVLMPAEPEEPPRRGRRGLLIAGGVVAAGAAVLGGWLIGSDKVEMNAPMPSPSATEAVLAETVPGGNEVAALDPIVGPTAAATAVPLPAPVETPSPVPTVAPPPPRVCTAGPFTVSFDRDSADLRSDAETVLANAASAYTGCLGARILLTGHAGEDEGMVLARDRVLAVRRSLQSNVPPDARIVISLAKPGAEDGLKRPENRRVEISFRFDPPTPPRAMRATRPTTSPVRR
ncbi:protein kinase domain-containing protein [Sphingomonas sp.]|uniref:protein kinase domain-containing protein n=1 Tax=Sphingomonas sp. TaxID=28214 RepID=UPI003B00DAB1